MNIENYIEIVKKLRAEDIDNLIICKILEEMGKDRRTETMEKGKNNRINFVSEDFTRERLEKPKKPHEKAPIKESAPNKEMAATDLQRRFLTKMWGKSEKKKFLKELGFDGNFEYLTKKKAIDLISKIKEKEKENQYI
ncbi:MAG: hypothetical protein ACFFHD_05610 [Promethearchaeota archaeon]